MDCGRWLDLYDAWRTGGLDPAADRACRDHLAACPECAELHALLSAGLDVSADPDADLTAGILAATSGPPCVRARERLGEAPGAVPDELLAAHLDHCTDCAGLAAVLDWLPDTLSDMAEAEPDAAFTFDVLRGTAGVRARRRAGALPRLRQRLGAWWERQVARPQFAWEAAWVAATVAALLFLTPFAPGRGASERALRAVQAGPVRVEQEAGALVRAAGDGWSDLAAAADARHDRAAPFRADARRHAGDLGRALLDGDLAAARDRLGSLGRDAAAVWTIWRDPVAPVDTMPGTHRDAP